MAASSTSLLQTEIFPLLGLREYCGSQPPTVIVSQYSKEICGERMNPVSLVCYALGRIEIRKAFFAVFRDKNSQKLTLVLIRKPYYDMYSFHGSGDTTARSGSPRSKRVPFNGPQNLLSPSVTLTFKIGEAKIYGSPTP
ncbi:hypothetical protein Y032_0068g158 [Ancylostoma ceylanicum]|uniref:Uncharacterized protein n=1 Tax=Ancylostoma ceylanicum TaxID=53326 RepID=A0A016TZQ0_9BILA|nr:hypothetical protein Y032_0068g158 [Ancylostoma ceylanicum]